MDLKEELRLLLVAFTTHRTQTHQLDRSNGKSCLTCKQSDVAIRRAAEALEKAT